MLSLCMASNEPKCTHTCCPYLYFDSYHSMCMYRCCPYSYIDLNDQKCMHTFCLYASIHITASADTPPFLIFRLKIAKCKRKKRVPWSQCMHNLSLNMHRLDNSKCIQGFRTFRPSLAGSLAIPFQKGSDAWAQCTSLKMFCTCVCIWFACCPSMAGKVCCSKEHQCVG